MGVGYLLIVWFLFVLLYRIASTSYQGLLAKICCGLTWCLTEFNAPDFIIKYRKAALTRVEVNQHGPVLVPLLAYR